MIIFSKLLLLCGLAAIIVVSVRLLVVPGIDQLSQVMKLSTKARGQLLGYATSTPELVIILASAASGVFDAGFWNIASSNIINWVLFMSAVIYWGQLQDLRERPFIDELLFGVFSVLLPLLLFAVNAQSSVILGLSLILVFVLYKFLDHRWNHQSLTPADAAGARGNLSRGLALLFPGILLIVLAGWKLGFVAEALVLTLGISPWIIGWLLGFVSSIPEMSGFFEVYRKHKLSGTLHDIHDSQEALDSLVASNMSNLCIILPLGILVLVLM